MYLDTNEFEVGLRRAARAIRQFAMPIPAGRVRFEKPLSVEKVDADGKPYFDVTYRFTLLPPSLGPTRRVMDAINGSDQRIEAGTAVYYNGEYIGSTPVVIPFGWRPPTDDTRLDCWAEQDTVMEG